jgi:hypothetical protein
MAPTGESVEAAYAQMHRLVARPTDQDIDPARFEWYVVDEEARPIARPGRSRN